MPEPEIEELEIDPNSLATGGRLLDVRVEADNLMITLDHNAWHGQPLDHLPIITICFHACQMIDDAIRQFKSLIGDIVDVSTEIREGSTTVYVESADSYDPWELICNSVKQQAAEYTPSHLWRNYEMLNFKFSELSARLNAARRGHLAFV